MMIIRMRRKDVVVVSTGRYATFVTLLTVAVLMLDLSAVRADDKNITRLLNNQAIVNKQIMCVLEKSPCDQLGRQLKGSNICM